MISIKVYMACLTHKWQIATNNCSDGNRRRNVNAWLLRSKFGKCLGFNPHWPPCVTRGDRKERREKQIHCFKWYEESRAEPSNALWLERGGWQLEPRNWEDSRWKRETRTLHTPWCSNVPHEISRRGESLRFLDRLKRETDYPPLTPAVRGGNTLGHIDLKQRNSISGLIKACLACIMHWAGLERAVWLVEFKTIPRKSTCFVWKRMGLAGGLGDPQNVWDLIIIIIYAVLFSYHCDKKNHLKKNQLRKKVYLGSQVRRFWFIAGLIAPRPTVRHSIMGNGNPRRLIRPGSQDAKRETVRNRDSNVSRVHTNDLLLSTWCHFLQVLSPKNYTIS